MNTADLRYFDKWFSDYTGKIMNNLKNLDKQAIELKVCHTHRVRKLITDLATSLGLDDNHLLLAQTIALFHDIGRFPQWEMWQTFTDSISANHGLLGVSVLEDSAVFDGLLEEERHLILTSIAHHNAMLLPPTLSPLEALFLKLLRDADRLDIFQVHANYRQGENLLLDKLMKGGLPSGPAVSEEILDRLLGGEIPNFGSAKSQNDVRLIVLGWVFDLSFAPCCKMVIENSTVEILSRTLPRTEKLLRLKDVMLAHLKRRAEEQSPLPQSVQREAC